ncbi:MAG TPA: site-2 protease family protein [Gemmatimonadaceae bacterium]|nr:site-2 protease family protein [Gemmatimonadaceae bacterium]
MPLDSETIRNLLLLAPVLVFSVVAHEYAHGYAALKQGDTTAQSLGRLTWNPIKHIDPFMTILFPLMLYFGSGGRFVFGAAKPVPVDPRNYRQYRRGDIIVSLAGIATNLALAVLCTALVWLFGFLGTVLPAAHSALAVVQLMMRFGVILNLALAMFNLLPLPPLDGSHVAKHFMSPSIAQQYVRLAPYGFIILILLMVLDVPIISWWMAPAYGAAGVLLRLIPGTLVLPPPWT